MSMRYRIGKLEKAVAPEPVHWPLTVVLVEAGPGTGGWSERADRTRPGCPCWRSSTTQPSDQVRCRVHLTSWSTAWTLWTWSDVRGEGEGTECRLSPVDRWDHDSLAWKIRSRPRFAATLRRLSGCGPIPPASWPPPA